VPDPGDATNDGGRRRLATTLAHLGEPLLVVRSNRSLVLLIGAFVGLTIAEWGYVTALAVDALRRDGAIAVGLVGFRLFFAAVGGIVSLPFVEHRPGARSLSLIAALRAVLVATSACLAAVGVAIGFLLALVAVDAVISGAYRPAQSTLLPALARTPRELAGSAASVSIVKTLAQAIGAMTGGLLLTVTSPAVVFGGAAVLLAGASIMTLRLGRVRVPTPIAMQTISFRERTQATIRTVREPHVAPLLMVSGLRTFVRGMWIAIAVIASIRLLRAGSGGVGLLMLAAGIGSLLAVPLSGGLAQRSRLSVTAAIALIGCGVPLGVIAAVPRFDVAMAVIVAWGIGMAVADVATLSLLYRVLDIPLLPRVTTLIESSKLALEGIGGLLAPVLASVFDIRTALVVAAVPLPLAVLFLWRRLHHLDSSATERTQVLTLLHGVPCLSPLDMASLGQLATAVEVDELAGGVDVVRQGEPGDTFYVVKAGSAEVLIDGYRIGDIAQGGSFGERALLRNVPRTATVRSKEPIELLTLSRGAFLSGVTGSEIIDLRPPTEGPGEEPSSWTTARLADALARLSVFSHIDSETLRTLAAKADVEEWPEGATLIRQGDEADRFFVVLEGTANVFVDGRQVADARPGDQLGEIALLHQVPRTATVTASSAMRILSLHRLDFAEAVRTRVALG
jgi:CRP-like cAMP-binding protein